MNVFFVKHKINNVDVFSKASSPKPLYHNLMHRTEFKIKGKYDRGLELLCSLIDIEFRVNYVFLEISFQ